jgi:hypothetical protein
LFRDPAFWPAPILYPEAAKWFVATERSKTMSLENAALSDDGLSYDLRLDVTFSVIVVPITPTLLF